MSPSRRVRFFLAMFLVGTAAAEGTAGAAIPTSIRAYQTGSVQRTRSADPQGRIQLSVLTAERRFVLDLEPSSILAPGARTVFVDGTGERLNEPGTSVYRGHLADDPDADVRVSISGSTLVGSVRQGEQIWYFEPLRRYDPAAAANQALVYRGSDVDAATSLPGDCAVFDEATSGKPALGSLSSPGTAMRAAAGTRHRIVEVTLVADYQFFQTHGADSTAYMLSVVDRVAESYLVSIGVILQVVQIVVYDAYGVEPLSELTLATSVLLSLGAARRDYPGILGQGDLTHLFTGRNLDGVILGTAFRGGICGTTTGVGLSRLLGSDLRDMVLLVGHEIGHNLGAYHDGQVGTPCADEVSGYFMWTPFHSTLDTSFSRCSRETIAPVLEAAPCVEASPCGDGDLDPDEECDDGGNDGMDCCSPTCRFDSRGASCARDGNACTDDHCDGAGNCYAPQNDGGLCDDRQACTPYGICSAGTCPPDGTLRGVDNGYVKVRFRNQAGDHRMLIKAVFQGDSFRSSPVTEGVTVRLLETDGSTLHESFVAAPSWVAVDDSARRFRYVAVGEPLPEASGATEMSVRFRNPDNKPLKFRVNAEFRGIDLSGLAGRGEVGLEVTVGDSVEGICATAEVLECKASRDRLVCK